MSLPKPATPVINLSSPFAVGLLCVMPFSEGTGLPGFLKPPGAPAAVPTTIVSVTGGSLTWTTNTAGTCVHMTAGMSILVSQNAWLPTAHVTVATVWRKTDTTKRSTALFACGGAASDRCNAYAPYSDSKVYWEFGGTSGANSLVVSGLTFSTTPESWIFTGGENGSSIWQNGVKVGNQASALTRTSPALDWEIEHGPGASDGDNIDLNYFAVYNTQWDDATAAAWSAEPYALLYGTSRRSAFGYQKPTRRRMHV